MSPVNAGTLRACPHYGTCGGCTDLGDKTPALREALRRAGALIGLHPAGTSPPYSRRRADLAIRRHGASAVIGLHRPHSHDIVDFSACAVLHPALFALLAPLRIFLGKSDLLRREGRLTANLTETGPDLLLRTDAPASAADRTRAAAFTAAHAIPRLSHRMGDGAPETLVQHAVPRLHLGGTVVSPPPGAFLQATCEGETAIVAAVLAALPPALPASARIVDLYAGIGTLSFPLAARGRVDAYEGNEPALAALDAARRGAGARITPHLRDLVRQPLQAGELKACAAIVLDPPATGAPTQMRPLAQSLVPRIVYVSCNPATLARDAKILLDGGYTVTAATPVDQFIGTPRLESVIVFERAKGRKDVLS